MGEIRDEGYMYLQIDDGLYYLVDPLQPKNLRGYATNNGEYLLPFTIEMLKGEYVLNQYSKGFALVKEYMHHDENEPFQLPDIIPSISGYLYMIHEDDIHLLLYQLEESDIPHDIRKIFGLLYGKVSHDIIIFHTNQTGFAIELKNRFHDELPIILRLKGISTNLVSADQMTNIIYNLLWNPSISMYLHGLLLNLVEDFDSSQLNLRAIADGIEPRYEEYRLDMESLFPDYPRELIIQIGNLLDIRYLHSKYEEPKLDPVIASIGNILSTLQRAKELRSVDNFSIPEPRFVILYTDNQKDRSNMWERNIKENSDYAYIFRDLYPKQETAGMTTETLLKLMDYFNKQIT